MDDEFDSPLDEPLDTGRRNLSQLKREQQEVQQTILRLSELSADLRERLPLDEQGKAMLAKIASMKSSGAKNREVRFVAKYWPSWDTEGIQQVLQARDEAARSFREIEKRIEQWRDRLIAEDAALTEFMQQHDTADAQLLRQLVRAARKEAAQNKPPAAARKLFRLLRDTLQPAA